ncbi:YHYH domain-containing protein [Candidatus Omnitrophota bacterium]
MKKLIVVLLLAICAIAAVNNAYAHSGRTDSQGGHWNNVDYGYPVYQYH